ncbi:MAG: holo-ACP synthase [Planctomycetota bacterium]
MDNVIALGVDLVDVARIKRSIDRHGDRFLERVFTPDEIAYAGDKKRRFEHLAARFAAKEAALKAIGTGWRSGIAWTDIEVRSLASGEPALSVYGRAGELAREKNIDRWLISLSHTETLAFASVIGLDA